MDANERHRGQDTRVHLTESCDEDAPHLITHVETSRAGNGDVDITPLIHHALQEKNLLPKEHLTDTKYAEAKQFIESSQHDGIDFIAPTRGMARILSWSSHLDRLKRKNVLKRFT